MGLRCGGRKKIGRIKQGAKKICCILICSGSDEIRTCEQW